MSRLDDLISDLCLAIAENLSGSNGDNYRVVDVKQAIKDLMLELFEDNYKVLPIQPNGRPLFIANGILEEDYRKKVQEL